MSRRPDTTGAAGGKGTFQRLGDFVVRWPWVVIGCWAALAIVLPLTFPSLTQMAQQRPVAILPADAPVTVTTRQMTEAFHESGSENVLLVVLTNEKGLGPADEEDLPHTRRQAAPRQSRRRDAAGFPQHTAAA